ncbi:MAG: tandem-95 repeat protein [Nitrospirae bacterium]|nr:tandem-95 repeat protein [Nitrospirota bacterium]
MDRSWKKTKSSRLATYGIAIALLLGMLCPAVVLAGSLNAPQGPGAQTVTRYTLKNIYDRLIDGTAGTPLPASPFAEPPVGAISPTITGTTDYPLNDIMGMLPALDATNGATLSEVCNTKTFWGLRSGTGWGLKTGTRTCNRRPKAIDDSATTNEDTLISAISVIGNDTDDDLDALSLSTFTTPSANGGTVSQTGNTLNYTPPSNFAGKDSFQYTVSDGSLTDTGMVTVTVNAQNDAPVVSAGSFTVAENSILYGNLTGSDTEGSPLTYSIVSNTAGAASAVIISGTNAFIYDASSYEPPSQSDVPDSFTFRVNDGTVNSGNATISITITAVNDVPVLAVNAGLSVVKSTCAFIRNTALQVTDVDNTVSQLTYTPQAGGLTKGSVQYRGASTCGSACGTGSWAVPVTFTQDDIDNCRIRYNETSGTAGSDLFNFTVSDGSGGSIGSTAFNITVTN